MAPPNVSFNEGCRETKKFENTGVDRGRDLNNNFINIFDEPFSVSKID